MIRKDCEATKKYPKKLPKKMKMKKEKKLTFGVIKYMGLPNRIVKPTKRLDKIDSFRPRYRRNDIVSSSKSLCKIRY